MPDSGPIGCAVGADDCLWFAEKRGNRIGRISMAGDIDEFEVPMLSAGPDAVVLGPDNNIWVAATDADTLLCITPAGKITAVSDGISPGSKPLSISVRGKAMWFSESAASRIASLVPGQRVVEYALAQPESRATRHGRPSRRQPMVR